MMKIGIFWGKNLQDPKKLDKEEDSDVVGEKSLPEKGGPRQYPFLLIIISFILVLSGGLGFYFFRFARQPIYQDQKERVEPKLSPSPTPPVITSTPNVTLGTGFSFYLPANWTAKISSQSKQHFFGRFFIPNANTEKTYVEIESIATSRLTENPLITIEKIEQKKINNLTATLTEGKERFQTSRRQVKQATFINEGDVLVLTLYHDPSDRAIYEFDTLVNSVTASTRVIGNNYRLANLAYADESIAQVDKDKYTKIEAMGDPLPERITKDNEPYKDGYAKFYKFEAFKGQRLTAVAMEDRTTNPGSFIRTELFDEQGQVLDQKDTRIEFDAPYTGVYYYIVSSFNQQEGGYLLKVFDRNQTENLVYVKYIDGSERLIDPTKSPPQYGKKEVAILFQFINPIEVIDNSTVRYFAKPREFEPGLGLITTPVEVYLKQETYQDFLRVNSQLPEENPEYLTRKKITLLSPSKILIEPEEGLLFPENYHIVIVEENIGSYRFFTE